LFIFERESLSRAAGAVSHRFGGSVLATSQLNSKSKIQSEAHFQILRYLHKNPELSQRELCERVGISLGAINYCLKALIDRGLVKAQNFKRSPKKMGYAYFLTPVGMAEKTLLTARFLNRKMREYDALRGEIVELTAELDASSRQGARAEGGGVGDRFAG
jgi:EPS-associated MarR family transcriptional regulator